MTTLTESHGGLAHDLGLALLEASSGEVALDLAAVAIFLLCVALALHVKARLLPRRVANGPVCAEPSVENLDFDSVPVALLRFDSSGRLVRFNREAAALLRLPATIAHDQPRTWRMLFGPESFDEIDAALAKEPRARIEASIGCGDIQRWVQLRAARAGDGTEICVEDITERRERNFRLRHLVNHDPLTGLLNRRGFDERRDSALAASRAGHPLSLAYLDLDRFKLVNDLYGHNAGDHVLRLVADRLRRHIQAPHALARVGGDEFVMLFSGTSLDQARSLCVSALDAVRGAPFAYEDKAFSVDGSIGLAQVEGDLRSPDLIAACDRACAQAKRGGGGRIVVVDDSSAAAQERIDEVSLIHALRSGEATPRVVTRLQPIVSLHHPGRSLAYEVLLRMRDERGDPIPSARVVQTAERNGLTSRLDRHVLTHTLAWLDDNPAHRDRVSFVALNVSRASLNDERFLADVSSLMREHPAATRLICFDVSEYAAMGDVLGTHRFIDIARDSGARMAIDGFGANFMSFSHLKEFRSDFVKIDASLVRDINANPANYSIVRAIVDVCHDLGMLCVGEWAENIDIVRALLELRVDYAQGFALSEPLEPDDLLGAADCGSLVRDPAMAALLGIDRSDSRVSARS